MKRKKLTKAEIRWQRASEAERRLLESSPSFMKKMKK